MGGGVEFCRSSSESLKQRGPDREDYPWFGVGSAGSQAEKRVVEVRNEATVIVARIA
jgi:hypothetical protein